jgi:hypothetical protein
MPIFSNQSVDVAGGFEEISARISALQAYNEARLTQSESEKNRGDSLTRSLQILAGQKSSVEANQSRDKRNQETSFDKMISLINQSSIGGTGFTNTNALIRKNLLELVFKMKDEIKTIITEEAFRVLNCSQQETYQGLSTTQLQNIPSLSLLPQQDGIYVKVSDIDFNKSLVIKPQTQIGKLYYETTGITSLSVYNNYAGRQPFPMNFELNQRIQQQNSTFRDEYSTYYNGRSRQGIFDIEYTTQNGVGASGDYFRVFLLDREGTPPPTTGGTISTLKYSANTIADALGDYYQSIEVYNSKVFLGNLLNLISGTLSGSVSITQIEAQNRFITILNRIIGRCEPGQSEIDVSGVAKLSELDIDDNEFFTFTETELNDINVESNNQKQGVVEYVDCDNVKLPVNNEILIQQSQNLADNIDNLTVEQQLEEIERILDSIPQAWSQQGIGIGFDTQNPFNQSIFKKILLALFASIFTPKVLLPIFTFKEYLNNQIVGFANTLITSGNTLISSANTLINSASTLNNIINSQINTGVDFIREYKKFVFRVVGRIMNRFLELLFNMLKKNLLRLLREILRDIARTSKSAKLKAINAILDYAQPLVQGFLNYRECKSLIQQIQRIIQLLRGTPRLPPSPFPNPILVLSEFLPGVSPERGVLNIVEYMQAYGLRTGTLPDGSPNRIVRLVTAIEKGGYDEFVQNGKVEGTAFVPPLTGGLIKVFAKGR